MNPLSSQLITSRSSLPSRVAKTATANAPAQSANGVHALKVPAIRNVEAACALDARSPVSIFFIRCCPSVNPARGAAACRGVFPPVMA